MVQEIENRLVTGEGRFIGNEFLSGIEAGAHGPSDLDEGIWKKIAGPGFCEAIVARGRQGGLAARVAGPTARPQIVPRTTYTSSGCCTPSH